jgi:hypothetical protein
VELAHVETVGHGPCFQQGFMSGAVVVDVFAASGAIEGGETSGRASTCCRSVTLDDALPL